MGDFPDRYKTTYKDEAITAARELGYPKSVIAAIQNAKTETQISNIMMQARLDSSDMTVDSIQKKRGRVPAGENRDYHKKRPTRKRFFG